MNIDIKTTLRNGLDKELTVSESLQHRAVGDLLEADSIELVKQKYPELIREASSKRSIDDFSIVDGEKEMLFDIKTHYIQNVEGAFSMPNLISVKRLKGVLEDPNKTLSYVFVDYTRVGDRLTVEDVTVKQIWELDWSMLRIGALGKGQLQIKDANKELTYTDMGRDKWFEILKEEVRKFYIKQISKTEKEILNWTK
tara:strand:+ start:733 stop:1323 length:591 start_codon:yes stop_codon:yes gene_type:complete